MKFKPGDKVRFLNTKGGGTVVKEINAFMVSVAIEDGFEIPTLTSELVIIESGGTSGNLFLGSDERRQMKKPEPEPVEPDRTSRLVQRGNAPAMPNGIYIAWVPKDQQQITASVIDVYLINNTDSDILYTVFLKENDTEFTGIDFSSVVPRSKSLIESISHDDIAAWSNGVVQVLFFNEESEKVLMPVSSMFRIKGSLFYSEGSYHETGFLSNQKAILYTVCELNRVPGTMEQIMNEKENREPLPPAAERFRPEAAIDRHRIAPNEAEVDLHISALRDSYEKLSPHEILTVQLAYFERMLASAIAFRFTRVVFIHGIGNGTLRQSIIKRLADYEDIIVHSAAFSQYGNGALEVLLKGK